MSDMHVMGVDLGLGPDKTVLTIARRTPEGLVIIKTIPAAKVATTDTFVHGYDESGKQVFAVKKSAIW